MILYYSYTVRTYLCKKRIMTVRQTEKPTDRSQRCGANATREIRQGLTELRCRNEKEEREHVGYRNYYLNSLTSSLVLCFQMQCRVAKGDKCRGNGV